MERVGSLAWRLHSEGSSEVTGLLSFHQDAPTAIPSHLVASSQLLELPGWRQPAATVIRIVDHCGAQQTGTPISNVHLHLLHKLF